MNNTSPEPIPADALFVVSHKQSRGAAGIFAAASEVVLAADDQGRRFGQALDSQIEQRHWLVQPIIVGMIFLGMYCLGLGLYLGRISPIVIALSVTFLGLIAELWVFLSGELTAAPSKNLDAESKP